MMLQGEEQRSTAIARRRAQAVWPRARTTGVFCALLASGVACTHNLHLTPPPPRAAAIATAGPFTSMIFAARTDSGVFVIDLGWGRASSGLHEALATIDADTTDVHYAFLTHAHRDHIGAWSSVVRATFVMGRGEVPRFLGDSAYTGFAPRLGEALKDTPHPRAADVTIHALDGDTMFVFGRDTLHAYAVPGHTPGSTVYLFRETLFAGDAANYGALSGFRGALSIYSDDVDASHASMRALFARLDATGAHVRTLCTAHAKCAPVDSALRARVTR